MTHRVAALAFEGMSLFELGIVTAVFGHDPPPEARDWYTVELCSAQAGLALSDTRLSLTETPGLDCLATADTVVVTGIRDLEEPPPEEELGALRAAHAAGARLLSVCTGAFVLAAAGLLDGHRATTHWRYADLLARRYPKIAVTPDVLYVDEGAVLTSAGSAAGLDLGLHVVRTDHGARVANAIARSLVVPPHRDGGQAQYVEFAVPDGDASLHELLSWARDHLGEDLRIERLAAQAAMSTRTLARRFRAVTGTTPSRWVQRERLARAAHLLESTDLPVERIALLSGYASADTLREHFRERLRTSPTSYRRTFRRAETNGTPVPATPRAM